MPPNNGYGRRRRRPRRPVPQWQGLAYNAPGTVDITLGPRAGERVSTAPASYGAPAGPSSPSAPGAAGGTPPAPGGTPSPYDSSYDATVNAINTGLGNTLADLTYDETRLKQDYGFDDPSNPYNRAAMLRRAFEQQQRGTQNSYAARGQLYSGAIVNAQNENQFGYNRDFDSLSRAYKDALNAIERRRLGAGTDAAAGTADAAAAAADRASRERPEDPGAPEQPQSTGPGVSWAVWGRWTPEQRRRYRARHRSNWDAYRPR